MEIEDVLIFVKIKGKHHQLVPLQDVNDDAARMIRRVMANALTTTHAILEASLEETTKRTFVSLENSKITIK